MKAYFRPMRLSVFLGLGVLAASAVGVGWALNLSKNVPAADSVNSIRSPSLVTVISMLSFNFSKFGTS